MGMCQGRAVRLHLELLGAIGIKHTMESSYQYASISMRYEMFYKAFELFISSCCSSKLSSSCMSCKTTNSINSIGLQHVLVAWLTTLGSLSNPRPSTGLDVH